jgi:hypothetical protein
MKNIIYLITLILVFSCKAQKNVQGKIIGTYKTEGVSGEIILKKDSSFTYQYNAGLINTKSKGTWELTDKTLILKSNQKYLTNQIKVKEYIDKGKIIITDSEKNPIIGAYVVLDNNQNGLETNDKGFVDIGKSANIESFEVHYLGETYKYKIANNETNSYGVTIYLADLSKTYFDNHKFKIKNKSLISNEGMKFVKQ